MGRHDIVRRIPPVTYQTVVVHDVHMFSREAGSKNAPVLLLLHGFPSASRMFATLMPLLADQYHVIAPDYAGFGHSDAPAPEAFFYSFDHLAAYVDAFAEQRGLTRYARSLQDDGGPLGFRIAVAPPERVTALIIQHAVVHREELSDAWNIRKALWQDRVAHEEALRHALRSPDVARQWHTGGVPFPERRDPDTWMDECAFLTKPGMDRIQRDLIFDYRTNVAAYPRWQAYVREPQPPTLVMWGTYDPLFTVSGALAFGRDVPDAEMHFLHAGHVALDEEVDMVAMLMQRLLARLR
jgi:pimeloyl-ACP methyl ester carboxylesterase